MLLSGSSDNCCSAAAVLTFALPSYLGGLDGVVLIVHGGGWACHVVDLVHLRPKGFGDVMPHELEIWPFK